MQKRNRFNRMACGSSRGGWIRKVHEQYLREQHNHFIEVNIEVKIPKRYFVKCFGKLIEVTEREALMLGKTNIKIY